MKHPALQYIDYILLNLLRSEKLCYVFTFPSLPCFDCSNIVIVLEKVTMCVIIF